ncbi:MAG: S8 family peptidase [Wenzhouxiangella sp.]
MNVRSVLVGVSFAFISLGGVCSEFKSTLDPLLAQTLAEGGARLIISKYDEGGSIRLSDPNVAEAMVSRATAEGSIYLIVGLQGDPVLDSPHLAARMENSARQSMVMDVVDEFLHDVHDYVLSEYPSAVNRYRFIPYVRMRLDSQGVKAVLAHPLVRSVSTEGKGPPLLNASIPFIGADIVHGQNIVGSGYVVSIIDTGVYSAHEMLGTSKIVEQACFSTPVNNQDTCSGSGDGEPCESRAGGSCVPFHGTHVAGIAAGSNVSACVGGTSCTILDDTLQGVAKSAGIISINAISIDDSTADSYLFREGDVIDALNEVYAHRGTYDIASVNMSFLLSVDFGDWVGEEACDSDWPGVAAAVNALHASGIAVVAAAGNCGSDEIQGCGSGAPKLIAPPACIANVISVSAVRRDLDSHASYANVADILDLLAPAGNSNLSSVPCAEWTDGVWSASHQWPTNCQDDYHRGIGTSSAAPHVTGAIALLRDEYGTAATPSAMLDLLKKTGSTVNLTQGGSNFSFPRIDLDSALSPPPAPSSPRFFTLFHECLNLYNLIWSAPQNGTVTEYQVEGSHSGTFDSSWREWFGTETAILVNVHATTWFRVRACNTVSCSGWEVAYGSASPTIQPCQ